MKASPGPPIFVQTFADYYSVKQLAKPGRRLTVSRLNDDQTGAGLLCHFKYVFMLQL
jgi:hypothetical protein